MTSALRSASEKVGPLEQVRSFVVKDTSAQACRDQIIVNAAATPTQRDLTFLDPRRAKTELHASIGTHR